MNLLKLVSGDNFVMYNIDLARATSPAAAAIYSALIRSYQTFIKQLVTHKDKEYFYMTVETMEEFTAYKRKPQDRAIKELIDFGLIETALIGLPAKRHFHITDKIYEVFGLREAKQESKLDQTGQPDSSNDFQDENTTKPLNDQLDQTGLTRATKQGDNARPNGATKIKNNINTKNNLDDDDKGKRVSRVILTVDQINEIHSRLRNEYSDMKTVSFQSVCNNVRRTHDAGKITVDYEGYLRGALNKRMDELEANREKRAQQPEVYTRSTRRSSGRKEIVPEWVEEQKQQQEAKKEALQQIDLEAERAELEKELQMYKK